MGLFSRSPAQPRSDAFTNNVDLVGITPYPAWTWPKTCKRGFTRTTAFRSSGQPCFLSDPFSWSRIPNGGPCVIKMSVSVGIVA